MSVTDYVKLLLWTASQLKSGQRDTIPADLIATLAKRPAFRLAASP